MISSKYEVWDKMYSVWEFDNSKANVNRPKIVTEQAQQERDRRANATELVKNMAMEITNQFMPLTASDTLSMMFRQRGIPCMDSFTYKIIGSFRKAMQFDPTVKDGERAFMPLTRWTTANMSVTLWTIEPVLSTLLIRGNTIDVNAAYDNYINDLHVIESMSMTTSMTRAKPDNEIRGRWAGWITWRACEDQGVDDPVCLNCNLSSILFGVTLHGLNFNMVHLAMTPETINIIAPYAKNMAVSLGVTVSLTIHTSTKLIIQPSMSSTRNTNLRMFGNGSVQFCGSPMDVELLFGAARKMVKKVMEADMHSFLSSMRLMKGPTM